MNVYDQYRSISIIYGPIIDAHNDQLPVGLMTQLVEHCIGIFQAFLATALVALKTARIIHFHFNLQF